MLFSFLWDTKLTKLIDYIASFRIIIQPCTGSRRQIFMILQKNEGAIQLCFIFAQNNVFSVLINEIVRTLKEQGRIFLEEGHGKTIELVVQDRWDSQRDSPEGIFLIHEIFQLKGLTLPFSEVSLDVVDLSTTPVIFHSPVNERLVIGPIIDQKVKFVVLKEGFWNKLLFNLGRPLIYQPGLQKGGGIKTAEKFPLETGGIKEMYLGPEGQVKILKG